MVGPLMKFDSDGHGRPAAVVAGVDVNGLGVVRSLGAAGVPILALDTDLTKATLATRYGKKIRVPALSGEPFVEALLSIAASQDYKPVLILTQEDSVATVSESRDRLAKAYHFSMPSQAVMRTLMDKQGFQRAAENLNCPIPRSMTLTRSIASAALEGMHYPCVLKPLTKEAAYSRKFAKAYKLSSAAEVIALWSEMQNVVREVMVQEWIEGGDSDVYFCLQYRHPSGAPHISFVGRKTCQWPPLVGGTASCVAAPEASAELVALTDEFFGRVGFVGLGSMEYKRDPRDNRFYMVEPTVGRTDYQEEIATLNGVNIPLAAYCGELGLPFPPAENVATPRAWSDRLSSQRARQSGAEDSTLRHSPHAKVHDAYFRMSDPGPYFRLRLEPLSNRWSRICHLLASG